MKKKFGYLLFASIFVGSCAKDYTCNCDGGGVVDAQSYTIKAKKESDAKSTCDSYASNTAGIVTCTLQ